jgi:hypothetical protein
MPVHSHDGTEGLEPEGVGHPAQKLVTAVVVYDRLSNQYAKFRHAIGQPVGDASTMKRQVCTSGSF